MAKKEVQKDNNKDNILMFQNYVAINSIIDEKYWEDLGFPIVCSSIEEEKEFKDEIINDDEYIKFFVERYEHGAVNFHVKDNTKLSCPWDSAIQYMFAIKTKNPKILKSFSEKLQRYFNDLASWINGWGFEYDDDFRDEELLYNDWLRNELIDLINPKSTFNNDDFKKFGSTSENDDQFVEKYIDYCVNNKNTEISKRFYLDFENVIDEQIQEILTELYKTDDGKGFIVFDDVLDEINLDILNENENSDGMKM